MSPLRVGVITLVACLVLSAIICGLYVSHGVDATTHPLLILATVLASLGIAVIAGLLANLRQQLRVTERGRRVQSRIFADANILFFSFDPQAGTAQLEEVPAWCEGTPTQMDTFPQQLVEAFGLDEKDADALRQAVTRISDGGDEADCTILAHLADHGDTWVHLRLLGVEKGEAGNAAGYGQNVTDLRQARELYDDESLALQGLADTALSISCINLTKNAYVQRDTSLARSGDEVPQAVRDEALEIEPLLSLQNEDTVRALLLSAARIPNEAQRHEFVRTFSRAGLLLSFSHGERNLSLDTQQLLDGSLRWVQTQVKLLEHPDTGDVIAFAYVRDINDQKVDAQILDIVINQSCEYIAVVDVEERTVQFKFITEGMRAFAPELFVSDPMDFATGMRDQLAHLVNTAEWPHVSKLCDLDYIIDRLNREGTFTIVLDLHPTPEVSLRKQVQHHWMDESHRHVLLVQSDVTKAYETELRAERLRREASTDPLTGLPNRRGIRQTLDELELLCKHDGTPFTLAMGDIDFFKKVNDTYGHDCGDMVLKEIAAMAANFLRDRGAVGRMGGEEFLLVLSGLHADEAADLLEEFLAQLRARTFTYGEHTFNVTMTIGVKEYTPELGVHESLQAADDKLYVGKQAGRDRVVREV